MGGARDTAYVRDVSEPTASVGAQLRPGAVGVLLGVPATLLAERHTCLDDIWGRQYVAWLREKLLATPSSVGKLAVFEHALMARITADTAIEPTVARGLLGLKNGQPVAVIVADSGFSHRHFNAVFAASVGLTPKRFARVLRFQRFVQLVRASGRLTLAQAAFAAGYSDQSHLRKLEPLRFMKCLRTFG